MLKIYFYGWYIYIDDLFIYWVFTYVGIFVQIDLKCSFLLGGGGDILLCFWQDHRCIEVESHIFGTVLVCIWEGLIRTSKRTKKSLIPSYKSFSLKHNPIIISWESSIWKKLFWTRRIRNHWAHGWEHEKYKFESWRVFLLAASYKVIKHISRHLPFHIWFIYFSNIYWNKERDDHHE